MIREKIIVEVRVATVLEVDGVNTMDKTLAWESTEFQSSVEGMNKIAGFFFYILAKGTTSAFRFLEKG